MTGSTPEASIATFAQAVHTAVDSIAAHRKTTKETTGRDSFACDPYKQTAQALPGNVNKLARALRSPGIQADEHYSDAITALLRAYEYLAVIASIRLKRFLGFRQASTAFSYPNNHKIYSLLNMLHDHLVDWRAHKPASHTACDAFKEENPPKTLRDKRLKKDDRKTLTSLDTINKEITKERKIDQHTPENSTAKALKRGEIASWSVGCFFLVAATGTAITLCMLPSQTSASLLLQLTSTHPMLVMGTLLAALLVGVTGLGIALGLRGKRLHWSCSPQRSRHQADANELPASRAMS